MLKLNILILVFLCMIHVPLAGQSRAESKEWKEPIGDEAFSVLKESFGYDESVTLGTRIISEQDRGDYINRKFAFINSEGQLVPGYLAIPN